ncbi:hypothetical protein Vafri_11522 [Volvox africanus]|nr:hypothetical protein Vafri_11522 [Volvox africanus]
MPPCTTESVLVLAGGVGYILESVRRCGLRRQRFLDAQDVSYVALSETITSSDVRFFLAFVPRVGKPDNPCNLGGDDGGSSGQLTVPYEPSSLPSRWLVLVSLAPAPAPAPAGSFHSSSLPLPFPPPPPPSPSPSIPLPLHPPPADHPHRTCFPGCA